MGVCREQGTWWMDSYEGGQRRRKKTRASTKTEANKKLEQVGQGSLQGTSASSIPS
jgi:hypothetical protein